MSKFISKNIYGDSWASPEREAILLVNLGSPNSPEEADVASYLKTFLMDERVISIPHFWRSVLVKGLIVPRRAKHSAANYRHIWDEETESFPLIYHSSKLAESLAEKMQCCVGLAMRYGNPNMDDTLKQLKALHVRRVKVLPLYPHYTRSSFETASVYALERLRALDLDLDLEIMSAFYDDDSYRKVLADSVRPYLRDDIDKLIISMHGIPLTHLPSPCREQNGQMGLRYKSSNPEQHRLTCYRCHCEDTMEFLRQDLGLKDEQVELVYQSRLGNQEWMRPYFADRVKCWADEGVKRIAVVCPGFVCDCLETIHEVDVEYKAEFLQHGGECLDYIPCLNSSEAFVSVLEKILSK